MRRPPKSPRLTFASLGVGRYSTPFAHSLATFVRSLCTETSRVAFLCCPTGYVGFQHTTPLPETKLLEFDRRFGLFAGKHYVPYDIDEPEDVPEELRGTIDIAVADPPFLNEVRRPGRRQLSVLLLTAHTPSNR